MDIVEDILSHAINDLEPTLIRNGYDAITLAVQFKAKPGEIKAFFAGTLAAERTQELTDQMRAAGVPL